MNLIPQIFDKVSELCEPREGEEGGREGRAQKSGRRRNLSILEPSLPAYDYQRESFAGQVGFVLKRVLSGLLMFCLLCAPAAAAGEGEEALTSAKAAVVMEMKTGAGCSTIRTGRNAFPRRAPPRS